MTELTQDLSKLGMEDFKKRFDPDLNVNDFSAVHEAYQYLVVEYVEKVINYSAHHFCFYKTLCMI